ncbi:hypothetical protein ACIHDR_11580 [Nocardia sp. NPDC052278]|uniref:hypothetical protein n=1 Tax=Nocardia sp. NPDC052278 TaxID=3364328 RepID=UPI0037C788F9
MEDLTPPGPHTPSDVHAATKPKPADGEPTSRGGLSIQQCLQLSAAVQQAAGPDGWTNQATVGHLASSRIPGLREMIPPQVKFGEFIAATGLFDIQKRDPGNGKPPTIYIRNKSSS